jgi:hypothetical protein
MLSLSEVRSSLWHVAALRIACAATCGAWSVSANAYRPFDGTDADRQRRRSRGIETIEAAVLLKGMLREGSLQDRAGWSVATEFGALLPATNVDDEYGASAAVIASLRNDWGVIHLNRCRSRYP